MPRILALCASVPEKFRRVPAGLVTCVVSSGIMPTKYVGFVFRIYTYRVLQGWTPEGMNACKAPPAYEGICRQFVVVAGTVVTKNDCKCGEPSDRF